MRLKEFTLRNFKGFEEIQFDLDENFTLFVGENGSGKTSILQALMCGLGEMLEPVGLETTPLLQPFVRVKGERVGDSLIFQEKFPLAIELSGEYQETRFSTEVHVPSDPASPMVDTSNNPFRKHANFSSWPMSDPLPLIAFYPTGGDEQMVDADWKAIMSNQPMRKDGYSECFDSGETSNHFANWMGRQEAISFQKKKEPKVYSSVKKAVASCIPHAKTIQFDAEQGAPVLIWEDGTVHTFNHLSSGQKKILTLVGDLARRATLLNPHWAEDAPKKTQGIVLIDEIDIHLHPRWQRQIVDDLKSTFPNIQFISTSHSPFIIQSLDPGELRSLDGESSIEYANRGVEEIVRFVQGVEMPETSLRYSQQKDAAKRYFELLRRKQDGSLNGGEDELEKAKQENLFPGTSKSCFDADTMAVPRENGHC